VGKRTPKPVCIDFETDKIEGRPFYPPKPVGVSIKYPGKPASYYAWGHATDNSCDLNYALVALRKAWEHKGGILCHNAKFDLDVAEVHLGLPMPAWDRIHDTMFLLFLDNPHRQDLGLKPAAEAMLGMAPDERDVVADWLIENQPVDGIKITLRTSKTSKAAKEAIRQGLKPVETAAGAYIAYAPGVSIVGPYANGDTERTAALFDKLYPSIVERGMLGAYDRERKLMPILLDMEQRGLRVDTARLASDVAMYRSWDGKIDAWLRKRLKVGKDVNLDSDEELLAAMEARGVVDTSLMGRTAKTGKVQMTKDSMAAGVSDAVLAAVLKYRTQLATCMKIFMLPWLEQAQVSGGLIFTNWNQTRGERGGARTGRLSSSPPFMNIPQEFAPLWGKVSCPWNDLPDLPLCRGYIIPLEKDHVLIGRDYSQQEPRIFAHFEDGDLFEAYSQDPWTDFHDTNKAKLAEFSGREFSRKAVKVIGLGLLYGMGVNLLSAKSGESVDTAGFIKKAIMRLYPGLDDLYKDAKARSRQGLPFTTWGGRAFLCEPKSTIVDNASKMQKVVEWDYKMPNAVIQGSAADCTKEAVIRFAAAARSGWHMVLQVHDEIAVSAPAAEAHEAMECLRACMESIEFDVKMLSEGEWSAENWASMKKYDVKGVRV
jgi:DNA polymerase I-like protein with 3'-5' exonuclease and polymerase domains